MYSLREIKQVDKKTYNLYKEYQENTENLVLMRKLVYEIKTLQDAINYRLKENKVSEEEYDLLLDINFKWNSLISLRRLPRNIQYFPENQSRLNRNLRKVIQGVVVSNKMDKTALIRVTRKVKHPIYKKFITKSRKYHVHDERNELEIGDLISAMECRPLSKNKTFRLYKLIEKAK